MPKQKTKRSAAKRFEVTGSGKLMRRRSGKRHILEKKCKVRKKNLGKRVAVSDADVPRVKTMLGLH